MTALLDRVEAWIVVLASTIIIAVTVSAVAMQEQRLGEMENRLAEHLRQPVLYANPLPLGSYNLVATYTYPVYKGPTGSITATVGSNLPYAR